MNKLAIVLLLLMTNACKHKTTEQQFLEYVNNPENKITQQIKVGETQVTIKLLTDEYRQLLKKDIGTSAGENESDYYYFNIKFAMKTNFKPEKEKILYLNFDMQKDFVMMAKSDSVPAAICQKIENGVAGSYEYMLAFEKSRQQAEDDFKVFYQDKIFGTGTIVFVYMLDDIKKIPVLKNKLAK